MAITTFGVIISISLGIIISLIIISYLDNKFPFKIRKGDKDN